MTDNVMTKTFNVPERDVLDKNSIKYEGVNYGGVCRAAKSLIIEFLKTCFENLPENHEFKFHEEQKYSKISILDKLTFNLDQVDKRPAIVINRGTLSYNKIGRDQRVKEGLLQRREDISGSLEGSIHRTGLMRGNLTIQCYGKGQTLQAELLGESVFELVTDMEDALRRIGFVECYAGAIGEEMPVVGGSKIKYVMVPVSVIFSMQRTWSITPVNLRRLNDVVVKKLTADNQEM